METQQNLQVEHVESAKMSVSFFFLSLGLIITLITSVIAFLNLVFETLSKCFPDVLNSTYQYGYYTYDYNNVRTALATLIIFFPVFIAVSYFWNKFLKGELTKIDELIKKWLIYIILFFSAVVTAIDLVALVQYFVSGEITTRFILKVFAVLVVAVHVGVYFIFKLQNREKIFILKVNPWFAVKSSMLVVVVVIWSFTVIGTPGTQRAWRLDERRIQDLQNIQYQIINFWQQKEKLPQDLEELKNPFTGTYLPVPPEFENGEEYEYKVLESLKFELCATFAKPIPKGWNEYGDYGGVMSMMTREMVSTSTYPYPGPGGVNESWEHEAGRTCFIRIIDKDIYPPFSKPTKI